MKISFLIILFGYFISSKDIEDYFIYDLSANTAFTLPIPEIGYFPEDVYYFRMSAIKEHNYEFQHYVLDDTYLTFKVKVCGYKYKPTNQEIIDVGSQYCTSYLNQIIKKVGDYYEYSYTFSTSSMEYFVIELLNYQSLNFLKVNVYTVIPQPYFLNLTLNEAIRYYLVGKNDYYFIMQTPNYHNLEFQVSVFKEIINFQVNFCSSYSRPNTPEEESLFECGNVLSAENDYTKGKYITYIYPYTNKTVNPYLALHIKNTAVLEYLEVYAHCPDKLFLINLNEPYKVNMSQLQQEYLPSGHNYYFKMPAKSKEKLELKLSLYENETCNLTIYMSDYNYNPSDNEILNGEGNYGNPLIGTGFKEEDYLCYIYQFSTSYNVSYLAIRLENCEDLNYLQIHIYPQKSKESEENKGNRSYGLIIAIIIVSILIVAVIAIIFLKKSGYLRKQVNSNEIQI